MPNNSVPHTLSRTSNSLDYALSSEDPEPKRFFLSLIKRNDNPESFNARSRWRLEYCEQKASTDAERSTKHESTRVPLAVAWAGDVVLEKIPNNARYAVNVKLCGSSEQDHGKADCNMDVVLERMRREEGSEGDGTVRVYREYRIIWMEGVEPREGGDISQRREVSCIWECSTRGVAEFRCECFTKIGDPVTGAQQKTSCALRWVRSGRREGVESTRTIPVLCTEKGVMRIDHETPGKAHNVRAILIAMSAIWLSLMPRGEI